MKAGCEDNGICKGEGLGLGQEEKTMGAVEGGEVSLVRLLCNNVLPSSGGEIW